MRHIIFLNGIWSGQGEQLNTNFTRSISCYQLKHWLGHFGFRSQVIDYCQHLSDDEIISLLEKFVSAGTLAVAVSTTFWPTDKSIPANIRAALLRAKELWPNIKVISGGARKTWNPELFDKHFVGESEDQLVTWMRGLLGKSSLLNKKFNIVSLAHRFDDDDAILDGEALPMELGRGCIFKCKFCSHQNLGKAKFTYQRDFELILEELKYNYEKFGTTKYMFLDDTINEDIDKIRNLSTIKSRLGFDIEWVGYLRADLIWSKTESQDLLLKSGLRSCFVGIETFHNDAGKSIDKGWGAKHGKEFIPKLYNNIWGKHVNIHVNLIAGLPYETHSSLRDSLMWCISNPVGFHHFAPLTLYVEKDDPAASSEFTRNYSSYGYKNVNHETGYWESGTMNSIDAAKFCRSASRILSLRNRVSCWDTFSGTNLGYTVDQVQAWGHVDYLAACKNTVMDFKQRYIAKLNAIAV